MAWPRSRTAVLTEAQAKLVILYCRYPEDDLDFAEAFGVARKTIAGYRNGNAGRRIRDKLRKAGRLPLTDFQDGL